MHTVYVSEDGAKNLSTFTRFIDSIKVSLLYPEDLFKIKKKGQQLFLIPTGKKVISVRAFHSMVLKVVQ